MTDRRGFTLVELITALVLFGIVGTAIYQLLVNNQRLYREQTEQIGVNQTVRSATAILPGEFREMNAGDPAGSDIIAMSADALTYKAMRSLYVLCQDALAATLQLVLDANSYYGLQELNASRDSLVVFAEGDPDTRTDDQWLHADVAFVTTGTACPGGTASVTVTLGGLTAAQLGMVLDGSPVRGFEVMQARLYDRSGAYWLGARRWMKSGGWTDLQPVAGPLSSAGVAFTYYDVTGVVTAVRADVARVAITVQGTSDLPLRGGRTLDQELVTSVALRNNPIY